MQQNFSNPFAWKTLSVERTTGADFYVCIYTQTSTYKKSCLAPVEKTMHYHF